MKIFAFLITYILLLIFTSCEAENEYSTWPCRFAYDNSVHQDAALSSCMDVNVPGMFCLITESVRGGVKYLNFKTNHNMTSSQTETEAEKRAEYILGLNNGIIVGFGALSSPPVFYAFDRECPNCFDPEAIPIKSRPLSMGVNGIATCGVCHRQYDLNNNGFISSGENGKRLTRYRASTTGPFGVLTVN